MFELTLFSFGLASAGWAKSVTKPEVLHAETNAIAKLAKSTESGEGAAMFITHAPCLDCAKLVYQSGIDSVYYRNSYRDEVGVRFLEKAGVKMPAYSTTPEIEISPSFAMDAEELSHKLPGNFQAKFPLLLQDKPKEF